MRKTALFAFAFVLCSAASANRPATQVELSWFPYHHRPEAAWRLSVLSDGSIRYEESAVSKKFWDLEDMTDVSWVERPGVVRARLTKRKQRGLIESLKGLELGELRAEYSAEFSYRSSTEVTTVTRSDGTSHTIPAEVHKIITHAAKYGLRFTTNETHAVSEIYAPFQALEWKDPEHPDRAAIARFLRAWYFVLDAVGPVHGLTADSFRGLRP